NLDYSEEQLLLKDSAERFLSSRYDVNARQQSLNDANGYSAEVWSAFADMGWLALPIDEVDGGLGGDAVDVGLLMEAFGKHLVVEPYVSTAVVGASLLTALGSAEQRADRLSRVAS